MPTFPTKEADVVALAENMIAGYTTHAADFPSVVVVDLQTALTAYQTDKQSQEDAKAQAQIATATKDDKLGDLIELMKNDLKVSEVDVASDPEKLTQIGWGPKSPPQPTEAPGQPQNFRPTAEGPGDVWFEWEKPADGGAVRNYIIQRRDKNGSGQVWYASGEVFENWGTSGRDAEDYDITLTDKLGGRYIGNFDSNISSGRYSIQVFQQLGANPADSDELIGSDQIIWTGNGELTEDKILANKAVQNKLTGGIDYYDDDEQTVILTLIPTETESTVTRVVS